MHGEFTAATDPAYVLDCVVENGLGWSAVTHLTAGALRSWHPLGLTSYIARWAYQEWETTALRDLSGGRSGR